MLVSRDCYDAVRGFDEGYNFYFEDADFCRRVRAAGYDVRYEPSARVIHFGGASQEDGDPRVKRWYRLGQARYYALHRGRISFWFLKLYFFVKFVLVRFPRSTQHADMVRLFRELRRVPFADGAYRPPQ